MSKHYEEITAEDFDWLLESIVFAMSASQLLAIDRVYSVLSEEFRGAVLEMWKVAQEEEDEEENNHSCRKINYFYNKYSLTTMDSDVIYCPSHTKEASNDWI